jgi:site-specific DNA recombinase
MTPSHSTKNGAKRYRYYVCGNAQKRGWKACPSKSVPAGEIERFVVDRIKAIGRDPELLQATIEQTQQQGRARAAEVESELRGLEREAGRWNGELRTLAAQAAFGDGVVAARLADLHDRIRAAEQRATILREEETALARDRIDTDAVESALSTFEPVWESLTPQEQARIVHLLVDHVDYDGANGRISITFHPTGIKSLATQFADRRQEVLA